MPGRQHRPGATTKRKVWIGYSHGDFDRRRRRRTADVGHQHYAAGRRDAGASDHLPHRGPGRDSDDREAPHPGVRIDRIEGQGREPSAHREHHRRRRTQRGRAGLRRRLARGRVPGVLQQHHAGDLAGALRPGVRAARRHRAARGRPRSYHGGSRRHSAGPHPRRRQRPRGGASRARSTTCRRPAIRPSASSPTRSTPTADRAGRKELRSSLPWQCQAAATTAHR